MEIARLPIPGADAPDIIRGIEYLRVSVPMRMENRDNGCSRRWKRAFDVLGTSIRNGAKKVTMVCLESRDEQTADEFEIEDGLEEGITIINRRRLR